jgi:hypothetical protein
VWIAWALAGTAAWTPSNLLDRSDDQDIIDSPAKF